MTKVNDMSVVIWHECTEEGYDKELLAKIDVIKGKSHDKKKKNPRNS